METRVRLDIMLEPWYVSDFIVQVQSNFADRHVVICLLPEPGFQFTVSERNI